MLRVGNKKLHDTLWKILVFRDKVMKSIEVTIDRIPGLNSLIERITSSINGAFPPLLPLFSSLLPPCSCVFYYSSDVAGSLSIAVFIFTTIEPYLGPVLKQATGGLSNLSEEVINNPDQFAVRPPPPPWLPPPCKA